MYRFSFASRTLALAAAACISSCDAPPSAGTRTEAPPIERSSSTVTRGGGELKRKQMEFLNRIREADPQARTIDRAMLNEQNELGLILDRSVEMDKIPNLMRTMLAQMAKEFPGQDLTVIAYTPSNPPHKIGTARLNARTRDMIYTPEA
jgi:hypothetical protein